MGCDDAVTAALVAMNMSEVAGTSPANVSVSHAFALFSAMLGTNAETSGAREAPYATSFDVF